MAISGPTIRLVGRQPRQLDGLGPGNGRQRQSLMEGWPGAERALMLEPGIRSRLAVQEGDGETGGRSNESRRVASRRNIGEVGLRNE
jgi:hypothetical protein